MATLLSHPTESKFQANAPENRSLSGKYLSFFLDGGIYGIPVLKVREIISMLPITHVPQLPPYMKGVINLRGKVIPVVNLRAKFSLPEVEATASTCIIIAQIRRITDGPIKLIGLIVDAVEEVSNIAQGDIEEAPDFGGSISVQYILGMAKMKDAVKSLLDIDQIIAADTIERLTSEQQTTPPLSPRSVGQDLSDLSEDQFDNTLRK